MKRAIMRKVVDARKKGMSTLTAQHENLLLKMIDSHFFRSSACTSQTQDELASIARAELDAFFSESSEKELYRYLRENWYDHMNWRLWGRRHNSKIAISRTTMKVEAHWSILKRLYLLPYNRPRLDLLVHIIDSALMRKFVCDYKSLALGVKKPFWWKLFVRSWKLCSASKEHNTYDTCLRMFTCSCLAWQRSQFFLCKHLVGNLACPTYRQVTVNRSPPFVVIDKNSTRVRANIDNEDVIITVDEKTSSSNSEEAINPGNADSRTMNSQEPIGAAGEDQSGPLSLQSGGVGGHEVVSQSVRNESPTVSTEVRQLLTWFVKHVEELSQHPSGQPQLEYIRNGLAPRLLQYKRNVEKALNARQMQSTWGNRDTTYLP